MTAYTPAQVLRAAADFIEADPTRWGQGDFINENGCRCALGAITYAVWPDDTRDGNPFHLASPRLAEPAQAAAAILANYVIDYCDAPLCLNTTPHDEVVETVGEWNDNAVRTPTEVVAALRGAAVEADELAARQAARSSCPVCRGAGGWQQHDGAIEECPRGCMTGGAA